MSTAAAAAEEEGSAFDPLYTDLDVSAEDVQSHEVRACGRAGVAGVHASLEPGQIIMEHFP